MALVVPITTYFITGGKATPTSAQLRIDAQEGELCNNLYYLGKRGSLSTSNGLRIAFLSGTFANEEGPHVYTAKDVTALKNLKMPASSPVGVDILLTHEWPLNIENGTAQEAQKASSAVAPVADIAAAIKPRYHFAASEHRFYEREPYKNTSGFVDEHHAEHVTRFVGLGDALNTTKARVSQEDAIWITPSSYSEIFRFLVVLRFQSGSVVQHFFGNLTRRASQHNRVSFPTAHPRRGWPEAWLFLGR